MSSIEKYCICLLRSQSNNITDFKLSIIELSISSNSDNVDLVFKTFKTDIHYNPQHLERKDITRKLFSYYII